MKYLLAVDQGTTGTRAVLFDERFMQIGSSYMEHKQISAYPGWTEHDPEEIYRNTCAVMKTVIGKALREKVSLCDICGMGIANQGETVMAWDGQTGEPLGNAVVWHCTRSEAIAKRLQKLPGFEKLVREHTGLRISSYFSATKILWLKENLPSVAEAEKKGYVRYGTLDSFLIWRLSGGKNYLTDAATASRTMLFNIHTLDWDEEILKILGIAREFLPEVRPNCSDFGTAHLDFGENSLELPIMSSIVDQQAALFGQFCFDAGMAKATYGTGCFMLMNTGSRPAISSRGLLTSVGWKIGEKTSYVLDGAVYMAGAVMQWLRDKLGLIQAYNQLDEYALSLESNGGVYFVTAFSGLSAPLWDSGARGTIVGLTTNSEKAHIIRAAMESVAFQVYELRDCFEADTKMTVEELRVDGGLTKSKFLMQFQADLLDVPVVMMESCEATAKGAAMLAGIQAGMYEGISDLKTYQITENIYHPGMMTEKRKAVLYDWKCAVGRACGWEDR